jgi:hypothetical protein
MAAFVRRDEMGFTHITGISTMELLALSEAIIMAPDEDQIKLEPIARGILEAMKQTNKELEAVNELLMHNLDRHNDRQ